MQPPLPNALPPTATAPKRTTPGPKPPCSTSCATAPTSAKFGSATAGISRRSPPGDHRREAIQRRPGHPRRPRRRHHPPRRRQLRLPPRRAPVLQPLRQPLPRHSGERQQVPVPLLHLLHPASLRHRTLLRRPAARRPTRTRRPDLTAEHPDPQRPHRAEPGQHHQRGRRPTRHLRRRTLRPRTRHHKERGRHRPLPQRVRERHDGRGHLLAPSQETRHPSQPQPTLAATKPSAASCRPLFTESISPAAKRLRPRSSSPTRPMCQPNAPQPPHQRRLRSERFAHCLDWCPRQDSNLRHPLSQKTRSDRVDCGLHLGGRGEVAPLWSVATEGFRTVNGPTFRS